MGEERNFMDWTSQWKYYVELSRFLSYMERVCYHHLIDFEDMCFTPGLNYIDYNPLRNRTYDDPDEPGSCCSLENNGAPACGQPNFLPCCTGYRCDEVSLACESEKVKMGKGGNMVKRGKSGKAGKRKKTIHALRGST